jgi:VWFA-related protein
MKGKNKRFFGLIVAIGLLIAILLSGCGSMNQIGNIAGYVYVPIESNKGVNMFVRGPGDIPYGYQPLEGAIVSAVGAPSITITDENGYFLLSDVPIGTTTVTIVPPVSSAYKDLTTEVDVKPNTTVFVGNAGIVSPPGEDTENWIVKINQVDVSNWPVVKAYVQIIDPTDNAPILGAKKNDFDLEVNANEISSFTVEQAFGSAAFPASTSLVIDRSGSMEGENYDDQPLKDAKEAAKIFVNEMSSSDRAEVISFASSVRVDQPFTSDTQALIDAIEDLSTYGGTALYDGIWQGLDDTAEETNSRKAIVALTDGGENDSSSYHGGSYWGDPDNSLVIAHAQSLNIPVYTIGLAGFSFTRERVVRDYTTSEADLQEIARETGGEYFYAPTSTDLENIYQKITQRIEQQYIITFIDNTELGDIYYIKVKVYYSQIFGEAEKYIQL